MGQDDAAPWLFLVGIGEDGVKGLSTAAALAIEQAGLVIGGKRHLELAAPLIVGKRLAWASPIEDTFPVILARRGLATCVLATGDPFHFGVGVTLARHIPIGEIRCLPQPSAFSLLASRLGWPLQDCACVSLHGRALTRIVPVLQDGARVLALSWDGTTPAKLAALLTSRGFGPSRMIVGEALGGPRERLRDCTVARFDLTEVADLNIVALELHAEPGVRALPSSAGLPEDWFDHDGQITKSPIRAITLSALAPHPGETLWDVGAGSGSVGIEWLLAHPATHVVSIEKHPARAARILRNADHWGVGERLRLVEAIAPEALAGLSAPDAIFVGGGLTTSGVLAGCQSALRQGGRMVVNAVTIESQALLAQAFQERGGEMLTLSVSKAEPVGGFHGFRPAMPVVQWRWCKR